LPLHTINLAINPLITPFLEKEKKRKVYQNPSLPQTCFLRNHRPAVIPEFQKLNEERQTDTYTHIVIRKKMPTLS
jgi:hypothetical protein